MADNIVGIKIEVGGKEQVVTSLGELRKIIKDLQFEQLRLAEQFGEGSKEAVNAAKRVEELKDRIADAKSQADAFSPDAKFRAFSQSLQGVAGGFAAVQGAMAVFGVESEDLQKTLVKVQGALALSEGLNTFLDTGIQGFKNLISVIQNSTVVIKANELTTKAAAFTMKLFGIEVETTSVAFNVLKGAIAATGIGLLVVALGQAVSAFDSLSNASKEAADRQKEFNNTVKEGARFELDELTKTLDSQMKVDVAKAKSRGASEQEIFDIQQRYAKGKLEAQIRYYDEIKKIDQKAGLEALSNIEKGNADGLAAKYEFEAAERKRKEEARKKAKEEADKQREIDFQEYVKNLQAEKQRMDDTFALGEQMMKAESDAKAEQYAADEEELARHNKYILEQELAAAKQREEIAQNEKDAKFKIKMAELEFAQAVVNGLSNIYGQNKQIADVLFLVDKGLAIAKIIVNLQAEMSANAAANAAFGAAGLPATILMNTASKVRAATSIATIVATTVSKYANQNSSASTATSGGGMAAPVTPMPIQQTITQLNQGTINALGNQAIKAYVLESDVTNSQNRVTRILNSSRFK